MSILWITLNCDCYRTTHEACVSPPCNLGYERAKQILYGLSVKENLIDRLSISNLPERKPMLC